MSVFHLIMQDERIVMVKIQSLVLNARYRSNGVVAEIKHEDKRGGTTEFLTVMWSLWQLHNCAVL